MKPANTRNAYRHIAADVLMYMTSAGRLVRYQGCGDARNLEKGGFYWRKT
jgi:hypothetical protein